MSSKAIRLAIVATHPVQYQVPWYRELAKESCIDSKVFFLWDKSKGGSFDKGFAQEVRWDIPLFDGYEYEFLENISRDPGTSSFAGINNPDLSTALKNCRPDIVLFLTYNNLSVTRLMLLQQPKVPCIFRGDSHRIVPRSGATATVKRLLLQYIFAQFDAFLYVGRANRDYFLQHKIKEEQLFFCPHAVEDMRFRSSDVARQSARRKLRERIGVEEKKDIVLFAGKFEEKKRPRDLLEAFSSASINNAVLLFVGSGDLEDELKEQAALLSNIYFLPFQNQTEIPEIYAGSDVFVLPSFGEFETWGLAVNEALLSKLPVIVSSHVGSAPDLVQNSRNGIVFEAGNVKSLEKALVELFHQRENWDMMGAHGIELVENYSYHQMTEGLYAALKYLGLKGVQS